MSTIVKFGSEYLSLFENGKVLHHNQEQDYTTEIIADGKIQPIQFSKTFKKVLIQSNKSCKEDFEVIDINTNEISHLNLEDNLINIFWSQIEEDFIIAVYDSKINLIDFQSNEIKKTFNVKKLTKCKNCQNSSILCQFSLISLVGKNNLCLITPFVSNKFKLDISSYTKLKEALPNIRFSYFDECFTFNKKGNFYEFISLFGIDIEPICYPLNINHKGDVVDFSIKNDCIFVLFDDYSVIRLSLTFPSLFDYQQIIDSKIINKIESDQNIEITNYISNGSFLFGFGNRTFQLFDECVREIHFDSHKNGQIIGVIKSKNKNNDINKLILLFNDYSIEEIDDESIYYESKLNDRFKYLQQRKRQLLIKQSNLEYQINIFESEISRLTSPDKFKSLYNRIAKLDHIFTATEEIQDIDIKKIRNIKEEDFNDINEPHSKKIKNQESQIEVLAKKYIINNKRPPMPNRVIQKSAK